jgi:hypothetical protein
MAKKMKPGEKRCPSCGATVKGPRTKTCPKCGHGFNGKPQAAVVAAAPAAPAVVEKPAKPATNGGTITLEQVKKVAQTVKTLGGLQRVTEVLAVIKEMGGVKKFKDLAEAMTATGTEGTTVTSTDAIPF